VTAAKIYIYGYGNPGRQDDGLGPALVERLETDRVDGIETDTNYQLNIEDADNISRSDIVIFVDASLNCAEPYEFYEIGPSDEITFTTHAISPQSVVALCSDLYNKKVKAFVLAIRGYAWELGEDMTPDARSNMDKAYGFVLDKIRELSHAHENRLIS
jgi:hydrogenase maturation protease